MKVGIDVRCLHDGKNTGVEEYTIKVLHQLFAMDQKNEYILFVNSYGGSGFDFSQFDQYKNVSLRRFRIPNKVLNFSFWYFGRPFVDEMIGGVDVFFMPNINFIALSKKVKLVLTMHDLSFELHAGTFSLKRRLWHHLVNPRKLCKRSAGIVAVSESTRMDIIERYHIKPHKIKRIYNGAGDEFQIISKNDPRLLEVKEKYHLPFKFIMYLGTIEPRKNIPALVKAFDQLKHRGGREFEKYKLVIAGTKGWKTEGILEQMRNARFTKDIIYTDMITNEDKPYVFNLASLFVYPSFFEGFGLPVLEAMKCGVPVVTSNTSSLGEVVGDAGILIDPDRPDELFLAMRHILTDKPLLERLQQRQKWQAFKFSWRTSARELLEVIMSS